MILDTILNSNLYSGINNKFEKAFKFLKENDLENMEAGKYVIDGDDVFVLLQNYTTKPWNSGKWEAHKKYIDIQYIIKGREVIGWTPVEGLTIAEDHYEEKDIAFYKETLMWTEAKMSDGYFTIFYPEDVHRPCCASGEPMDVKKAVVKIKL